MTETSCRREGALPSGERSSVKPKMINELKILKNLIGSGAYAEAKVQSEKLLATAAAWPPAHFHCGRLYALCGKPRAAKASFHRTVELLEGDGDCEGMPTAKRELLLQQAHMALAPTMTNYPSASSSRPLCTLANAMIGMHVEAKFLSVGDSSRFWSAKITAVKGVASRTFELTFDDDDELQPETPASSIRLPELDDQDWTIVTSLGARGFLEGEAVVKLAALNRGLSNVGWRLTSNQEIAELVRALRDSAHNDVAHGLERVTCSHYVQFRPLARGMAEHLEYIVTHNGDYVHFIRHAEAGLERRVLLDSPHHVMMMN